MIVECIQHPLIYDIDNLNEDRLEILLMHLDQLIVNGILLSDNDKCILNNIKLNINKWPNELQHRVNQRLYTLAKNNRIRYIESSSKHTDKTCKENYCDTFYSLIEESLSSCIVTKECNKFMTHKNIEFVGLTNYTTSDLYRKLQRDDIIIDESTSKDIFNREIIMPISKYTSVFKIYDRVFVNSMTENNNDVSDNFKRGLEYLLKLLNDNYTNKNFRIEIYSSLRYGIDNRNYKSIRENLLKYVETLKKNYKLDIRVFVKDKYELFPHSRHFVTDEVALTIDKGLDLLNYKNEINRNIISIMNSEKIIEIERARSLRNIMNI